MLHYQPMPNPPHPELFELDTNELLAQKASCEKSITFANIIGCISIPGMLLSGIAAFYEFAVYLNDKTIFNAPDETLNKDLKGLGGGGAATLGFFGIYKYAGYKIKKNQEKITSLDLELARRQLEAHAPPSP